MKKRGWLIKKRRDHGLSQAELAERVNISDRTISKIERGERDPSGYVAYRIAKELGFSMELFYQDEREKVLQ